MELRKFVAPEIVFGEGARSLAGQYIKNLGASKALIVSGPIVSQQAWFGDILEGLDQAGIQWILATETSVNPRDYESEAIGKLYNEEACDVILAVGGGSVIDCAKGVGVLVSNVGPIHRYEGVDEICMSIPPLICIPSTAGSAAEISQFAIITNTKTKHKMALVSKMLVPDLALVDPETTLTKPFDLTVDSGLDVLAHATEAMASNASSPFSDLHAKEAARLVLTWLPVAAREPGNLLARRKMLLASNHAGLAFSNASLGIIHAIAHALGGRFDLVHGELNGILLEESVRFNYDHAREAYGALEEVYQSVFPGTPDQWRLTDMYRHFIDHLRVNQRLGSMNADRQQMEAMIHWVLHDPCIATNPRQVTAEDVKKIYEQIW